MTITFSSVAFYMLFLQISLVKNPFNIINTNCGLNIYSIRLIQELNVCSAEEFIRTWPLNGDNDFVYVSAAPVIFKYNVPY